MAVSKLYQQRTKWQQTVAILDRILGMLANLFFLASLLATLSVLAAQSYIWLRTALWKEVPISGAFAFLSWTVPKTSWLGIQLIVDWLFQLPIAVCLPVLGFGAGCIVRALSKALFGRVAR